MDVVAYNLVVGKILPYLHKQYGIKQIIQLGDLLDFGTISRFERSKVSDDNFNYGEEVAFARTFWKEMDKIAPRADRVWIRGNHETRIEKYIIKNISDESMADIAYDSLSIDRLAKSLNVKYCDNFYIVKKKLLAVHGWSYAVGATKIHLDKMCATQSIIFGHTHSVSSHLRLNPIMKHPVGSWNAGTLSKIDPTYKDGVPTNWITGFAYVFESEGRFQVNQVIIIDGQAIIDGKVFKNGK
jgi:metallophosphoesterase superfamily enzyme